MLSGTPKVPHIYLKRQLLTNPHSVKATTLTSLPLLTTIASQLLFFYSIFKTFLPWRPKVPSCPILYRSMRRFSCSTHLQMRTLAPDLKGFVSAILCMFNIQSNDLSFTLMPQSND